MEKEFTNFHAKEKEVMMENHLYFVLKFKTRMLKETGERLLKQPIKQQISSPIFLLHLLVDPLCPFKYI